MYILEIAGGIPSKRYPLIGIFELDQAKALSAIGNKVVLLSLDMRSLRRKRKFGLHMSKQDDVVIFDLSFPLGRLPKCILNFFSWRCFLVAYKKIVKLEGAPDIIHAHFGRAFGVVANKAKQKFRVDYILTEHDSSVQNNLISQTEKKNLKNAYKNSLANIAVSAPFKEVLEKLYNEKFYYVPNIVDLDNFSINDEKTKNKDFKFVSVGNLNEGKNMAVLINSFAQVIKKGHNCTLEIIGEGAERVRLEKQIVELGLENKAFLKGQMPRAGINEVYSKSDCFVLASKHETFGVVYIEAMAAGLPVIATICGGPECFVNKENGLLVDVGNAEQLTEALENMIINKKQYNGKKIRQYCLDNFSPSVVAKKIIEVIEKEGN
ncbi:MAG: glycosyltransferase [Clostridia bacterium]